MYPKIITLGLPPQRLYPPPTSIAFPLSKALARQHAKDCRAIGCGKGGARGGEPTTDAQLLDVIRLLGGLMVRTVLLTNGYVLNENTVEELKDAGLDEICVSIKAIEDALHIQYTGKSNRRLLRNFKLLNKSGILIRAESVLIPQLIDHDKIKKVASFVASVDSSIPYRIDGYVPVPRASWRQPSREEILKGVEQAEEHLQNVSYISSGAELKGNVSSIYPRVQDESS